MRVPSPNIFSDDDEEENNGETSVHNGKAPSEEEELLKKMSTMLGGIPPPPFLAISRMSCAEILDRWQTNQNLFTYLQCQNPHKEVLPKINYRNNGKVSEDIAELMMKIQNRYIHSETMSTYSVWMEQERQKSESARKRRIHNGISPGRRLSHLARRRQVFSRANLQQLAKNEPKNPLITLKSNMIVHPRNVMKDFLDAKECGAKILPKRALFQSPEEPPVRAGYRTAPRQVPRRRLFDNAEKAVVLPPGAGVYDVSGWVASQPFLGGKKRAREDERTGDLKRKCPRRSLDFSDASPSRCSQSSKSSNGRVSLTSQEHKGLLWGVARALGDRKITHKEDIFKPCAKTLYSLCKKNLAEIHQLESTRSLSEKVLKFAKLHVDEIIANFKPVTTPLLEITSSELNQRPVREMNPTEGKENGAITPKRKIKDRVWHSCGKIENKRVNLKRSSSFEMIAGDSSKPEKIDETPVKDKSVQGVIEETPEKEEEDEEILAESPPEEDENFVPASQSDTSSLETRFPALIKNELTHNSDKISPDESPDQPSNYLDPQFTECSVVDGVLPSSKVEVETEQSPPPTKEEESSKAEVYKPGENTAKNASAIEKFLETDSCGEEDSITTSTPLMPLTKKLVRRPSWKVEKGPGLKLRVKLSQVWDIIGQLEESKEVSKEEEESKEDSKEEEESKEDSKEEEESSEDSKKSEELDDSVRRISTAESTATSMESYTLTELRDRLAIEETLARQDSEISFIEMDSDQESDDEQEKPIIVTEIFPEVTIPCYKKNKQISKPSEFHWVAKVDTSEEDDIPLAQLISQSQRNEDFSEDDIPLSALRKTNVDVEEFYEKPDGKKSFDELTESNSLQKVPQSCGGLMDECYDESVQQGANQSRYFRDFSQVSFLRCKDRVEDEESEDREASSSNKICQTQRRHINRLRKSTDFDDRNPSSPAKDFEKFFQEKRETVVNAITNFSCAIQNQQKIIQDTVLDDEARLRKLERLDQCSLLSKQFVKNFQMHYC